MIALALTLAALAAAPPDASAVAVDAGGAPVAAGPVFLRAGEGARVVACAADAFGGCGARLRDGVARWSLVRAVPRDANNVTACGVERVRTRCAATLDWVEEPLPELDGHAELDVGAVPALRALGTHRLRVRTGAAPAAAPFTALRPDRVLELVVRRDDGYVGRLTELLGAPFVLYPTRLPDGVHQTDARLAADCAALVIYGRRRLGEAVRYGAPASLLGRLDAIAEADALVPPGHDDDPVLLDAAVREGDVLHLGFQTAVLAEDRPPVGRLGANDLVIHTYHAVAELRRIGALPYRRHPVRVLRWPGRSVRAHPRPRPNPDGRSLRSGRRGTSIGRAAPELGGRQRSRAWRFSAPPRTGSLRCRDIPSRRGTSTTSRDTRVSGCTTWTKGRASGACSCASTASRRGRTCTGG